MTSKDNLPEQAAELRRRPEEIAREKAAQSSEDLKALSPEETQQALHELRVHQIALEMQNEELQRAQAALDAARARYFNLYDLAPVGYCTLSEEGLILEANLTAATLLGGARGALVKQPVTRFILKDDQDLYCRHRKQLLDTGEPQACELRMVKKDGTAFWARLETAAAPDADGAPAYRVVLSDITERQRLAEEALRESEARWRTLVENMGEGISIVDLEERILFANPAAHEVFGVVPGSLSGRNLRDFVDSKTFALFREQTTLRQQGHKSTYEFELIRPDGERRHLLLTATPVVDHDGQVTGTFGIYRDITERKWAEEALQAVSHYSRNLIETSLDPLVTISAEGKITDVNTATEKVSGLSRERLIGTDFSDYFTDPEKARAGYQQVFREGKVFDYALDLRHRDGHITSVLYNASVYRDEVGQVTGVFAAARDITERRRAEEALQATLEQLRALAKHLQGVREEERKDLAREIHDGLGQALTGLKMDLAWLRNNLPPATKRNPQLLSAKMDSLVNLADRSVQEVRRLITQLRPPVLDNLGLEAAIEWQVSNFRQRTGIAGEFVSSLKGLTLDPNLATALFRILQEALTNVARHAQAAQVKVRLGQSASALLLEIEDNGRGITESELRDSRSFGIIGMRERALIFGGEVNFTGQSGKGTSVRVLIPLESP